MLLEEIREILKVRFQPDHLEITDDSALHAGHTGSRKSGGSHYSAVIVSGSFTGKSLIERHRLVYDAVFSGRVGEVHALALKTYTPEEWARVQSSPR